MQIIKESWTIWINGKEIIKENWTLWNAQEMRILVLASLCFQFGLFFLSPFRKRTGKKLLISSLWLFYLLADKVATLALGSLIKKQTEGVSGSQGGIGLGAFWAPFLLLHLGGPDTITSFGIEDNELWSRQVVGFFVQVGTAITVLFELVFIPPLAVPACFVFIAGLMKFSERTWALYSSSKGKLRSSMFEPKSIKNAGDIENIPQSVSNTVDNGYDLFKRTMPLVADLGLTSSVLYKVQADFRECSVWDAFKLVEIELSFLYDLLHTKAVLFNGPRGCLWRLVSLVLICSPFVLFIMNDEITGYAKPDIIITYVLFCSALFMELISLLQIIFSDWMIVALREKKHPLLKKLGEYIAKVVSFFFSDRKSQWSNSMGQYSLLSFSLRDKKTTTRKILGAVEVKDSWDNFKCIHSVPVPTELKHLLVEQLRKRSSVNLQKLKDGKGEEVLQQEKCDRLEWSIKDEEFDVSILLWHIATDLCFHSVPADSDIHTGNSVPADSDIHTGNSVPADSDISLMISNYMVYLLVKQPSMMPDGIGKVRFEDTCAAVRVFYHDKKRKSGPTEEGARKDLLDLREENDEFLEKKTWSVLSDARRLANELLRIEGEARWHLISRVWAEMLSHAAINCKMDNHIMQLSKGGEFLTHVRLLMTHICIGDAEDAARSIHNQAFIKEILRKDAN